MSAHDMTDHATDTGSEGHVPDAAGKTRSGWPRERYEREPGPLGMLLTRRRKSPMNLSAPALRDLAPLRSRSSVGFRPGNALTASIAATAIRELSSMQRILGEHADLGALHAIRESMLFTLDRLGDLISEGVIAPDGPRTRRRPFRLGIFPIAANPLHWMHVLGGLGAMERFRLDRVVYIVAGGDPRKPMLAAEHIRHGIAADVLALFEPLLGYSAIARRASRPGEENVFRLIGSLGGGAIHAFYIAGSDHYHRFAPLTGLPDTIERLETGVRERLWGFDPGRQELSVVFLDRGNRGERVESFLEVGWVDDLPLKTSSTSIRDALCGAGPLCDLSSLPFSAYCAICAREAYQAPGMTASASVVV